MSAGCVVSYCCLTNGAPKARIFAQIGQLRQGYNARAYERLRKREAQDALGQIGIHPAQISFWKYPDLETHHHIGRITRLLSDIIDAVDVVFCCPFEGGHPDHDVLRFCLEIALSRMRGNVQLIEYASYNRQGWQVFLEPRTTDIDVVLADRQELELKALVAKSFASQAEDADKFSKQFERFRIVKQSLMGIERFLIPHVEPYYENFAYSQDAVRRSIGTYLKVPAP